MKSNLSFQEMAVLGIELLSKQSPITLEIAQAQIQRLKNRSSVKKKQGV